MSQIEVTFVTSSKFKREENAAFAKACVLTDGRAVNDLFEFVIVDNTIKETLDVSLEAIVISEVKAAYAQLKRPCIVEHAGLIFDEYVDGGYPGGLTKPMWDTLQDGFLDETHSVGRHVSALAVVGYCDGQKVFTFPGSTAGTLSAEPRGNRKFYWDTIFIPTDDNNLGLTYAQIVEEYGIQHKMAKYSQSSKAMRAFLEWRLANAPKLWSGSY